MLSMRRPAHMGCGRLGRVVAMLLHPESWGKNSPLLLSPQRHQAPQGCRRVRGAPDFESHWARSSDRKWPQDAISTRLSTPAAGSLQILVIALCLLCDDRRIDTQVIGMVAHHCPAWHVRRSIRTRFFPALFGGLNRVVHLEPNDRLGRSRCCDCDPVLFSSVSLLTPLTTSLPALIAVRFLAALGWWGAAGLIAITSNIHPKPCGRMLQRHVLWFPPGSVLAGVVSAQMVPHLGWQSVFMSVASFRSPALPVFVCRPGVGSLLAVRGITSASRRFWPYALQRTWNGRLAQASHEQRLGSTAVYRRRRWVPLALDGAVFLSLC